jgi:lipid-A-disaccharide synthase
MKYYLLAGEASGDLHGSNLMKAIQEEDPTADFRFWGGDLMQAVGGTLVLHYRERSFMGFTEVLMNIWNILGLIKKCKSDIVNYQPDVIIFIDNSGFNLRIAKWAKKAGFRTNYYISPQVWASRAGRVKQIKRDIDQMYVILPFEKEFYKKYNYEVNFVGHPLIDAIHGFEFVPEEIFRSNFELDERPIIALLPGSRKQEISKMLELMLQMVSEFKDYQFVVAGAPSQSREFYQSIIKDTEVQFVNNETYNLLRIAHAALVTSGTATLETALFKVPQVVCYKAGAISYYIAKNIITLNYISLVNLIMDREIVTELIQKDFNKKRLRKELEAIISSKKRVQMLKDYDILIEKLGGVGASKKTAREIVNQLKILDA